MVKKEPLLRDLLLTALVLTLFVFLIGYYVGGAIDSYRVNDVEDLLQNGEIDVQSFLLEQEFFDVVSEDQCLFAEPRLMAFEAAITELGETLQTYEARDLTKKKEYTWLRNRYFQLELRYYTLLKEVEDTCGTQDHNVILFFYDIGDHVESLRQGYVLDQLVESDDTLIVLSVDRGFDNSLVQTVADYYHVAVAPTLVINYDDVREEFVSEGELKALLAESS